MKKTNLYSADYVRIYKRKKKEGRLDRLKTYFSLNKNVFVLDVGCGSGFLFDLIRDDIKSYTGIDLSDDFINESKKTHKNNKLSFRCESSRNHAKKFSNYYKKIFMMDVTEHLDDETMLEIIKDCHKMLKKNGKLFIHTPNGMYFLEILKKIGIIKQTAGHIAIRSYNQYKKLIKKTDFSNIKIVYLNHYIIFLKPFYYLSYVPFIGDYFKARLLIIIEK